MEKLKEYFLKYKDKVSFIELKEGSEVDLNGYKVRSGLPLPITVENLIENVKTSADNIKFNDMIEGMIITIGIDENFPFADEYKKILKSFKENIEIMIINSGNEFIEKGEIDKGMIYLRAAHSLDKNNLFAIYNYSIALEEKAKKLYSEDKKELGSKFLNEAMEKMMELRDKDEKEEFPLAYYKLGYYYKAYSQSKKARDSWKKFLEMDVEEEAKDEIRNNLESIRNDVIYEEGCELILSGKPREGLEKLIPLTEKYEKWWNLDFMVGVALRQTQDFKNAIEFFKKVLEVNPSQVDTLNEMGLCKANTGDMNAALEFFNKAILMKPDSSEIICNRGMARLQLGDIKGAEEDINRAYKLNPEDEIVKQCITIIEKYSE